MELKIIFHRAIIINDTKLSVREDILNDTLIENSLLLTRFTYEQYLFILRNKVFGIEFYVFIKIFFIFSLFFND